MAIHKIKAKEDKVPGTKTKKDVIPAKKVDKKAEKRSTKTVKKTNKKPFILFRPFVAFGRYIKGSWAEIRQVRWPNRKLTWKMTVSVIVYVLVFASIIMLLDALFAFLFNQLLGA